jgi:lipopolysaccharide heptosyltransferase II
MKIGIDAREIQQGAFTGIGVVLSNFLSYFSKTYTNDTCVVFSNESIPYNFGAKIKNIVCQGKVTLLWDQITLPRLIAKERIDLFYSPYYKIPFFVNCVCVSTIHDLMFLVFNDYSVRLGMLRKLYYHTVGRLYAKRSDVIITVSEYSKKDIIQQYGINEKKIAVIPNGISDVYTQDGGQTDPEVLRKNWAITMPYVLYVGNFKLHKNVERLIEAFSIVAQEIKDVQLVLAGDRATGAKRLQPLIYKLSLNERIIFTGTIAHETELKLLYASAQVFIFPSLYEGFGLPPVEAMACGVPVIASHETSLSEVLGDAVLCIDPRSAEEIANAIKRVLSDEILRSTLIEKGYACAARYRIDTVGEHMYQTLKTTYEQKKGFVHENAMIKNNRSKILVVMLGGIGNMIMLTPMLRTLRAQYKNASITLLTGEAGVADILAGESLFDDVVLFDACRHKSLFHWFKTIVQIRKRKFDCAIMASNTHALKGSLLAFIIGAKYRIGENIDNKGWFYTVKVPFRHYTHECDGAASIVRTLGIQPDTVHPFLRIREEERSWITGYLRDENIGKDEMLIGIHAGSGEKQKHFRRWPQERFTALANELQKRYRTTIVLTGGPDEIELAHTIARSLRLRSLITAGKLSIRETAALIERCNVFVGNDSGLLHIAAAVHTPAVVIWGATNHAITVPRGDNVTLVRKDLPCSPCYKRGKVECNDLRCFTLITVDDVLQAVEKLLKREKVGEML